MEALRVLASGKLHWWVALGWRLVEEISRNRSLKHGQFRSSYFACVHRRRHKETVCPFNQVSMSGEMKKNTGFKCVASLGLTHYKGGQL